MDLKTSKNTPPWDWPEGTGKMLLEILGDERALESERFLAVELADDFTVIGDDTVDALLSILRNGNEPENLRAKAAISLGPALDHADTEMYGFDDDSALVSEEAFVGIQDTLRKLYMDADVPKEVRRRILEASVRAMQDWHQDAIQTAYRSDDEAWKVTAVFSMCWVRGFDEEILEALNSADPEIHYQAVRAAGNWEVAAAWPHIAALVTSTGTKKNLRLAAIDAVASIHPQEAGTILHDLTDSDDEDIVEAVYEAMAVAEGLPPDDELDEDELIH
ncbi:MAG: HEAT repeat domain-containing protein [Acidobacteria bacterium]|nr:MAG: HEAT repeat domain-containing protein [Acidobacteriota bacterium]